MKIQGKHFVVTVVVLLVGIFFVYRAPHGKSISLQQPIFNFEDQIGEWKGETPRELDEKILEVLRLNNYVDRVYRNAKGEWISLYVGYFEDQKSGQTIHSPKNCLPGAGWNFATGEEVSLTIESDEFPPITLKALRGILVKQNQKLLSYYWFQSRGRFLANEYWHKFYLVVDAIRYNRTDGALVRVLAPIPENGNIEQIDAQMKAFIKDFIPILQYKYFPEPVGS